MNQLQNLEQIRAKNALAKVPSRVRREGNEGDSLSGYPSLVINNGLIATVAYSIDKGGQPERIADAIAFHLNSRNLLKASNALELRNALCEGSVDVLREATSEALKFLSYLKRFQKA